MSQFLKGTFANLDSNVTNNPVKNTNNNIGPAMNNPENVYNDKYVLNDDDRRKIKTIEQCIITCVSASSLSDRMYNKISGKSTKDYRNMLIRRALLNVLKRQKREGLGAVSATNTFVNNTSQLFKVGYAKITGRGGKQNKLKKQEKLKNQEKQEKQENQENQENKY